MTAQAVSLLQVQQGGTGVGTITGIIKGNGTSAFSAIVSGTDIKTINSSSILGSGNLVVSATPAGSTGDIQFNTSSAFAADTGNLFWNSSGHALGLGTGSPTERLSVAGNAWIGQAKNGVYPYLPLVTDNSLTSGATTVNISDSTGTPTFGTVRIDDELISYTGVTSTSLTGCTRGAYGTTATSHSQNSLVQQEILTMGFDSTHPAIFVNSSSDPTFPFGTLFKMGVNKIPGAILDVFAPINSVGDLIFRVGSGNATEQFAIRERTATGFTFGITPGGLTIGDSGGYQIKSIQDTSSYLELATNTAGNKDTTLQYSASNNFLIKLNGTGTVASYDSSGGYNQILKTVKYNNIATAGWGVPAIYGAGRSTAQTAAVASVATYTVGGADGSFEISANANITAFVAGTFNVQVDYTDETNTSRTLTLNFSSLTGTIGIALAASGPFEGLASHIRCKASTSITIKTTGTFTSLTYNVEGIIRQLQ